MAYVAHMSLTTLGFHLALMETFSAKRIAREITDFYRRLRFRILLPFSCRGEKEVDSPNLQQQRNHDLLPNLRTSNMKVNNVSRSRLDSNRIPISRAGS